MKFLFALIVSIPTFVFSQVGEVSPPDYIKTIYFRGNTQQTQIPIIKLGELLTLEFDALNGDEEDYYYKIKHFDYNWKASTLMQPEFLSGLDNQRIRNYENSLNSYQVYSHYRLSIPNQFTKALKVSGNYMLEIYDDYEELVFSRKFMVYEEKSNVGVVLKRSRDFEFMDKKQRVEIIIKPVGMQFNNPLQNVKAVIIQNNNLNTAISNIKPQFALGTELIYRYDKETSFWGGNEYLYFENKDVRAAGTGIQFIDLKDLYHNYLFTNIERVNRVYTYNPDINGNYVVLNMDAENPSIEADYVWVHFSLQNSERLKDKTIHVYGNFNNYVTDESTLMSFNPEQNTFQNALLLKQGFYNYKFVVVDQKGNLDEGFISGNFHQTENNYKVVVYYRDLGGRFDRIIGIGEGSSVNISN